MPVRIFLEVEPPSPSRYYIGAATMMIGVVLPVGCMMFRNKRVPSSSSSSYAKQTNKVLIKENDEMRGSVLLDSDLPLV